VLREIDTTANPPAEASHAPDQLAQGPSADPTTHTATESQTQQPVQCEENPGNHLTPADRKLDTVFGDIIHPNDGTHLDGGVQEDRLWQARWRRMAQIAPTHYAVPRGAVGRRFLTILTNEFRTAREGRTSNSEKPIVFVSVILPKTPGVRAAKDIRQRLQQRMDLWIQGNYAALVDDTEAESLARVGTPPEPDEETRARAFNARVLSGRLRSAVRALTNRDGGGVL